MQNKKTTSIFFVLCAAIFFKCDNPFLPLTGVPVKFEPAAQRTTPQGLLAQLIESYESMRIDLFTDLLPVDGSFRFFIAPGLFIENTQRFLHSVEPRDTRLQYTDMAESYYYWTQKEEIDKHTRMFRSALSIDFKSKPSIESVRRFVDNGDSLAELKITGGTFDLIYSPVSADTLVTYPVAIDKQVFLIQQDANKCWVIKKWYDFGLSSD